MGGHGRPNAGKNDRVSSDRRARKIQIRVPEVLMKFKTILYVMDFDASGYHRELFKILRRFNEKAGTHWINAAVNQTPIPTWSGASRATFQKLAQELGTSIPIGPVRASRDRTALGKATSAGSGVLENKAKGYVGFVYETNLRYLAYNEYNLATAGPHPQPFSNNVRFTPYKFQSRAHAAWLEIASLVKMPDPWKHVKKRKI